MIDRTCRRASMRGFFAIGSVRSGWRSADTARTPCDERRSRRFTRRPATCGPCNCYSVRDLLNAEGRAQGELKKAINYTLNAFDALRRFVFDGRLEIDNNPIERCMRLIALAKKNSIGAGSHEAAQVWAIFYTLIESARLNRVNPRAYLNWVVEQIERSGGEIDHATLMPWNCPVGRLDD
ncbi:transposase (plasmid) [Falsirhodobacter algicola]|uniref:Transposase n=1 Tax=Falsirhodobacter algicola TaxID=2692330 RepID=A0A8J8MVC0_9RHOB|nr:transposase [Falsirhodobacter algicola]